MAKDVTIELAPLGRKLHVPSGTPLHDLLFAHGVEFPCGGRGLCKGCRVRVVEGTLEVTPEDRARLTAAEIETGWRLACKAKVDGDIKLDLAQWEATILADDTRFAFEPREGLGVAVDLGTTTIVAQLLDLRSGQVLGVRSALNAQARHGADIMSRVEFALAGDGQALLQRTVRTQVGTLVRKLLDERPIEHGSRLECVVIVGNSVMHHLFCGISVEPLSHVPFEPTSPGLMRFTPDQLDWMLEGKGAEVFFLPCLGGFVGSDILAGILACKLHESTAPVALMDLGTNGEIVVAGPNGLLCASTAAGPAFEGARISCGMRAATGAITEVSLIDGGLSCHVLGMVPARGICGSGLVDAIAAGLEARLILPSGRFAGGSTMPVSGSISLNQRDIRELQLAKGAIAAGLRILLSQAGLGPEQLQKVFLSGAFGNYINHSSARRIGLLNFPPEKVVPSGNTALLGAKIALFTLSAGDGAFSELLGKVRHVSLHEDPQFHDAYVEEMTFPD